MTLQFVRVEDLRRAFPGGDFRAWIARLCNEGAITPKLAERAHHLHCEQERDPEPAPDSEGGEPDAAPVVTRSSRTARGRQKTRDALAKGVH